MEERTTIQGLLSGTLTRDADPAAWDDDAYLFAKSRAWADDRDWMLEQFANTEYPVTHRMELAMFAGGQHAVTQAYTAIAATFHFALMWRTVWRCLSAGLRQTLRARILMTVRCKTGARGRDLCIGAMACTVGE